MGTKSLDRTICKRKSSSGTIAAIILLFFLLNSCSKVAATTNLSEYIGPEVGTKCIFEINNGGKLYLTGVSKDNNKLMIKETIIFAKDSLPPGFPETATVFYELSFDENRLTKQFKNKSETIIKANGAWKIKGTAFQRNEATKNEKHYLTSSSCKIASSESRQLFGRVRNIITTKCINRTDSNVTIKIEKYASGIGLIERIIKIKSEKNETRIVNSLILKEITFSKSN